MLTISVHNFEECIPLYVNHNWGGWLKSNLDDTLTYPDIPQFLERERKKNPDVFNGMFVVVT